MKMAQIVKKSLENVEEYKAERRRQQSLFWLCFKFLLKFKVKMKKNRGIDEKIKYTLKDCLTVSQSWLSPCYEKQAGEIILFAL